MDNVKELFTIGEKHKKDINVEIEPTASYTLS